MNEQTSNPVKWLRYLLYVGIAGALNFLSVYSLLGALGDWVVAAIGVATVYLLFRLASTNPRYQKAAVFAAAAWVCSLIGGVILVLISLVCDLIAEYQQYHAHGHLLEDRNPRLAGKWRNLFWIQFVGGLLLGLLSGMISLVIVAVTGSEAVDTDTLSTIAVNGLSLVLQVLYLVYLHRTIKVLETEAV